MSSEATMSVREAAIAAGWNPDEGSPWVGPDGVTYHDKQAFYDAQTSCPSWCTLSHTPDNEGWHTRTILRESFGWVEIERNDEGLIAAQTRVYVDIHPQLPLSVEEAAQARDAITEALRIIEATR